MKTSLIRTLLALGLGLSLEASASDVASLRVSLLASDEDLESRDFGTGSHFGLHLRSPELGSGLRAEAELSVLISANNAAGLNLRDNASYVRLSWRPESWSEGEGLVLTFLPLSSTRLFLGYEYPASWGRDVYGFRPLLASGAPGGSGVPGLELRLAREHWYVFAAARSSLEANALTRENERLLMGLAGAGVDVLPPLRLEAAGTLVQHGVIPVFAAQGRDTRARTVGVSGRILFHHGAPIGPSVDFSLYRRDPEVYEKLLAPEVYPGGVSASVSLEASHLVQTLQNPDMFDTTTDQGADVLALQARLKVDFLRVHALALARSASFVLSEVPGVPPFIAFPQDGTHLPELLVSAGMDHHFPGTGLTPGLLVRAVLPSTTNSLGYVMGGNNPPATGNRLVVLRGPNAFSVLPEGRERQPLLTAKATLRWDVGDSLSVIGEAFYTRDPNHTVFREDENGVAQPVLERPSSVGGAAVLQARF
ncbi:MAG TPA: hypothetical protein VF794_09330 [Archangium sp.]|uniref:hypothetical protein n=1 Tax=Archangium sp. TaxID=1872627 RepID=UPI002EDB8E8F